jgi:hypothetical protein
VTQDIQPVIVIRCTNYFFGSSYTSHGIGHAQSLKKEEHTEFIGKTIYIYIYIYTYKRKREREINKEGERNK